MGKSEGNTPSVEAHARMTAHRVAEQIRGSTQSLDLTPALAKEMAEAIGLIVVRDKLGEGANANAGALEWFRIMATELDCAVQSEEYQAYLGYDDTFMKIWLEALPIYRRCLPPPAPLKMI